MAGIAPVAVDAMGGDNAPAEVVRGALRAATTSRVERRSLGVIGHPVEVGTKAE